MSFIEENDNINDHKIFDRTFIAIRTCSKTRPQWQIRKIKEGDKFQKLKKKLNRSMKASGSKDKDSRVERAAMG